MVMEAHIHQLTESLLTLLERYKSFESEDAESPSASILMLRYLDFLQEHTRLRRSANQLEQENKRIRQERDAIAQDLDQTRLEKGALQDQFRRCSEELQDLREEVLILRETHESLQVDFSQRVHQWNSHLKSTTTENAAVSSEESEELATLRQQFMTFLDQYEARERYLQCTKHTKSLELQIAAAKLLEQKQLADEAQLQMLEFKERLDRSAQNEADLRRHLESYKDQFRQMEDTLSANNQLFKKCQQEMESIHSELFRLEAENERLRSQMTGKSKITADGITAAAPDSLRKMSQGLVDEITTQFKMAAKAAGGTDLLVSSLLTPVTQLQQENKSKKLEQLARSLLSERNKLQKQVDELQNKVNFFELTQPPPSPILPPFPLSDPAQDTSLLNPPKLKNPPILESFMSELTPIDDEAYQKLKFSTDNRFAIENPEVIPSYRPFRNTKEDIYDISGFNDLKKMTELPEDTENLPREYQSVLELLPSNMKSRISKIYKETHIDALPSIEAPLTESTGPDQDPVLAQTSSSKKLGKASRKKKR